MKSNHVRKHHNLAGEHPLADIGQILLFFAFNFAVVLDIFILKYSGKIIGKQPGRIAHILFLLFFAIGGYFVFTSHKIIYILKNSEKENEIATDGVFTIVRHPLYFGSILIFFGFVVLSYSVLAFLVWLVICFFYYFITIYEEKLLIRRYGEKYKEYQKRVPMLIPFL
ncbi:MAG: isoprenylcysteine carboxylmethyltransferase family protein [Atribacterota bacterium]